MPGGHCAGWLPLLPRMGEVLRLPAAVHVLIACECAYEELPDGLCGALCSYGRKPCSNRSAMGPRNQPLGYRLMMARKQGDRVRLYSRNGYNWAARYPRIAQAVLIRSAPHATRKRRDFLTERISQPSFESACGAFVMRPPSLVPESEEPMHLVLCDFGRQGLAYTATDPHTTERNVIENMLHGQTGRGL